MKHAFLLLSYCLLLNTIQAQTIHNEIPQVAYDNYAKAYNYTFWDDNFKTNIGTSPRKFSIQTSSFGLNVNYEDLNIQSLNVYPAEQIAAVAFAADRTAIFPEEYSGAIDFAVLQDGDVIHEKSASPTRFGNRDSQMAEYGTWLNRRFVSAYFTNNPPFELYYTGLEFTNWHNRLKVTLHVRPTTNITNGQLQLAIEIPSIYSNQITDGTIYGFANATDAGFAVKGGTTVETIALSGNTLEITTAEQDLVANTSYEVSLIFYALKENVSTTYTQLSEAETEISIQTAQSLPNANQTATTSYVADEGIHYIEVPRYGMGYNNCSQTERLQNIEVALENTSNEDKRVRLCFRQIPNVNVVGFNSILRNNNGDPAGFPLQVSKNWHDGTAQLFSGSWIREYTEIIVPANATVNFDYTRTGAKWGETYSASSHQLSVVGAGIPKGGWLEAALGSFGESITHSPDYLYGNSNICDYRPFLVTNEAYEGTSSECFWTGNVGGMDMWVYTDDNNQRIYQSQVKTRFQRYSPNLTETSISAYSSDNKLKLDYTFFLNRSDDYVRVFYKIKIKALENAPFNRFDIFQMGGDIYNLYKAQTVQYGNLAGIQGQLTPTNSGVNDYTSTATALTGNDPWIWAGNGTITNGFGNLNIETNNGIIIRDYQAKLGGMEANTPYFRERSSSQGFSASSGQNPTSYCLVPPSEVSSFLAGDSIELVLETVILPKQDGDYYGPNANFAAALATYDNSVDLFLREVQGNAVVLNSPTNTVNNTYPYSVVTTNNTALVELTGGKSYVPIVFKGLDNITNPSLWKARDNCWELVDQSTSGKDFWQADYQPETGKFDLIYNVLQDVSGDTAATIAYYLGTTPPTPSIVTQIKRSAEAWTANVNLEVFLGDSLQFDLQAIEAGNNVNGDSVWSWTGPNDFTAATRLLQLPAIADDDLGVYEATYTNAFGCQVTETITLTCADQDNNNECDIADACSGLSQNAILLNDPHLANDVYGSSSFIESTATIDLAKDIEYQAGEYILLKPGFNVQMGADFHAFINNCASPIEPIAVNRASNIANGIADFSAQLFPNPLQSTANIRLHLPTATSLKITVYDLTGKHIDTIIQTDYQESGDYTYSWDCSKSCVQGMYILSIQTDKALFSKKMMLIY